LTIASRAIGEPLGARAPDAVKAAYWRSVLMTLFLYRCAVAVLAQSFITSFTWLGDYSGYSLAIRRFGLGWYLDPNAITINIGTLFSTLFLGSGQLVNLGFQCIAFFGMYRLLMTLEETARARLALLLFFPSFTLWSSLAGKEAILVFAVSMLCAYLVELQQRRQKLGVLHVLALYLVAVFKPHYLIAFAYAFGTILVARFVRQKAMVALIAGIISLLPMYLFRETISELSFAILPHFFGGNSTREVFWVSQYDVFWKAPVGIVTSFFGPTPAEALDAQNVLHVVTFVEGIGLAAVLLYYALRNVSFLPAYGAVLSLFALFWMLFPNYPFGVMNPGSAIRYRTGFAVFIFVIFAVFMLRSTYELRAPRRGSHPAGAQQMAVTSAPINR
jgi:hypothetical protein